MAIDFDVNVVDELEQLMAEPRVCSIPSSRAACREPMQTDGIRRIGQQAADAALEKPDKLLARRPDFGRRNTQDT